MSWSPDTAKRAEAYKVLLKKGDFIDSSRDNRAVPYKIYHPVDHDLDNSPVILWSHGFGGNKDGASFISRFLAGQGYTVVHMTHLGTDSSLWEGKSGHPWDILRKAKISREDTLHRMYDVTFVLDQLSIWMDENPDIGQYMNLGDVGMSGHSFGAMTTQVISGMLIPDIDGTLLNLRDERVTCGILYSPVPIGHLTDETPETLYGPIDIPLLHMTGTDDDSPLEGYDYKFRLVVKDHAGNPEQYVQVLEDGDHMVYNGTRGKLKENPKRDEHEQKILDAVFAFWQTYMRGDEDAKVWLKSNLV